MSRKKWLIQSLIGGSVLALAFKAASGRLAHSNPNPGQAAEDTNFGWVDSFLEQQMKRQNMPGAAWAIVKGDQIVHYHAFGRERPGGETPTPQTPFFIGSLTKSITALAVMQLVETGKIDLDAPVQRYLPWFMVADPGGSAELTVRHLLNQTSGLPMLLGMANLGNLDDKPDAAERQVRSLSTLKLTRPVGSKFEYSNLNYNILGLIIEAASGETYESYIKQHVFEPLQMSHSYTSKGMAKQDRLAVGHRFWFGFPVAAPDLIVPRGSLPSGQLIASVEDMAHFLIAQLNGGRYLKSQLLSPAGIDELQRGAAEIIEMGNSYGSYAMGWIDQRFGASRIVSHSGIVPDFGGFMAVLPHQKMGLVMLYNANHAAIKLTMDEIGLCAAQRLAGVVHAPPRLGAANWLTRALLLIPLLQVWDVAATVRKLNHWRQVPASLPDHSQMWERQILLPLIPNLLVTLMLIPMLGKIRGFMKLFAPDLSWISLICGSAAGVWSLLRTGLLLRTTRKFLK